MFVIVRCKSKVHFSVSISRRLARRLAINTVLVYNISDLGLSLDIDAHCYELCLICRSVTRSCGHLGVMLVVPERSCLTSLVYARSELQQFSYSVRRCMFV